MDAMIEIRELSKRFGPMTAVDNVSFNVDRGEILGFLGPNGAGKSTTMKMITGFITPDAGSVKVMGHDVLAEPLKVKSCLGYLPEGAPLYGDMTPRAFLDFAAQIRGFDGNEKKNRIDNVISQTSLESVLDKPIDNLSKGFKRRVGLAQAILHDPAVLVLDEPTDGLDPNQKHEVRTLIQGMSEDKVIILSTHILEEVDAVCSRAIIIAAGKVVSDGTPEALLARSDMHNAITLRLRGRVQGARDALASLPGAASVRVLDESEQRTSFQLVPQNGASIADPVGKLVRDNGWDVEEMYVERGRLDDVFRQITTASSPTS